MLSPLAVPDSWLARRDPTAKLFGAALMTVGLLVTIDPTTAAVGIALELAVVPFTRVGFGPLWRRGWPIVLSALGIFVFTVLLSGNRGGPVVASVAGFELHRATLHGALGYSLRLIALGLPGFLIFATIDPTDLADSLVAHLRVPHRFAIGALAAFRLVPLLSDEWRLLSLARRARGIDAGWSVPARLRLFASTTFALLVAAIRRAIRLSTAMDARGFDSSTVRTRARPTHFGWLDALVIALGAVLAALTLLLPHTR